MHSTGNLGQRLISMLFMALGDSRVIVPNRSRFGVQDEFTFAAIAQNLRELAKLRPKTAEMRVAI